MEYVCTGATLKCTMGTSCPKLKATPKNVSLTGKDQANVADYVSMVNIPSFGRCRSLAYPPTAAATAAAHGKLTPMPCVPGTCPKWKAIDKDSLICGEPALLKPATLKCMYGGIISIVDPGQTLEIKVRGVSEQSDNKKREKAEQEIPEELLQEFNELDKEGLNKDSVLDGVQLALDAAGMVPVLGAIPDLINASISVLRGDWVGAGLSVLAAVPLVGDVAGGAKLAYKGAKIAKKATKSSKIISNVAKKSDDIASNAVIKSDNIVPKITLDEKKNIAKKYISKDVTKDALLKEKGVTPDNVDEVYRQVKIERKREAIAFYKEHLNSEKVNKKIITENIDDTFKQIKNGNYVTKEVDNFDDKIKVNRRKIANEINGIDFNYKVERISLKKGDVLYQHNNGRTGNYCTDNIKQTPSESGISAIGTKGKKAKYEFVVQEDGVSALKTTSKKITDNWSLYWEDLAGNKHPINVETIGGGSQYYIPGSNEYLERIFDMRQINIIISH